MDLDMRLRKCERRLSTLSTATGVLTILLIASAVSQLAPRVVAESSAAPSIRASEIVVVDPNGVERVRIGGQLPDAVPGKPRGDRVAGVLLYDQTGRERSGYVTFESSGNVGRTVRTQR